VRQVGQVTSDNTEAIDTAVTIRWVPPGYPGRSTGALIGLDAIGTGADGSSHADALNLAEPN
jgi:hypothetical protein